MDRQREPDVPTSAKIHYNIINFVKRQKSLAEKIENAEDRAKADAEVQKLAAAVAG